MGARLSRSSNGKLPEPEINVTPLVDVVLVLLIIFMVITPALDEGEHVELPAIFEVDEKKKELDPIELTVAVGGVYVLQRDRVSEGELDARLRELHRQTPERKLMIKADMRLDYGQIRQHFARAQDIGFSGVKLKVEKRKEPGPPDA